MPLHGPVLGVDVMRREIDGGKVATSWGRKWAWVLLGWILLGACVKQEVPAAGTAAASPEAATPAAPQQPTGKYGEVAGQSVLGADGIRGFQPHGKTERVKISYIPVQGQAFTEAVRAQVIAPSERNWDVQLQAKTTAAVERGDVLLATFHFRTEKSRDESGEGQSEFIFELAREPWTKSVAYAVRASQDWRQVYVPFVAKESYTAGEAQMLFRLGYQPETIDIGGVTVENFGKQLALADLPVTKITYRGMEPNAAWRTAAAERIERHRKAPLFVVVQTAAGQPVVGTDVSVKLHRHSFNFGTCAVAAKLASSGNEKYKQTLREHFNYVTLENNLKWVALEGDWGPNYTLQQAEAAVAWLQSQSLRVRGHVLVWPGWRNLPKSLQALEQQPQQLRNRVEARVREMAAKFKGKLADWDVMNEPFDNHDLMDILGNEVMIDWFKLARESDPTAQLFINDYAILSGGGGSTAHRDHYEQTIQFLLDGGAPLDAIGMQGHYGNSLTAPEDMLAILDRFARFQKPIHITEYDVAVEDEALAARYTEDFYTTAFSHPAVQGIIMWGFWDGAHWKKNAPMYRQDWSLKPAGEAYRKLVERSWSTEAHGKTDAQGVFTTRGFLGEYRVHVGSGTQRKTFKGTLTAGGTRLVVTLE